MQRVLLLLLAVISPFLLISQSAPHYCGTQDSISSWLARYQAAPQDFPKSDDILYLPAAIHIVGTDEGTGYFSLKRTWDAFCTLNSDLAGSNIQLYLVHPINYINESDYYNHPEYGPGYQMMQVHNFPNVVNSYIVDNPAGNCGYYNGLGVAINKGCNGINDHTWVHEIGHYLQLPHTFLGWEGVDDFDFDSSAPNFINGRRVERVNGEYCTTAGDGFCDTPPDYISDRWSCNNNNESNVVQTDPNGETFQSDATYFMSYALDGCVNRFSDEQNAAMRAFTLDDYGNVLIDPADVTILDANAEAQVISPVNNEVVPVFNEVELDWEAVPGAYAYHIQVTFTSTFAVVTGNYMVYDATNLVVTDLNPDNDYYWRVRPIGATRSCAGYSEIASFLTGTVSSTDTTIPGLDFFSVHPNPLAQGQEIRLNWSQQTATNLDVVVYNQIGQKIHQQRLEKAQGAQSLQIATEDWAAGVYMVGLQRGNGTAFRRVVIR